MCDSPAIQTIMVRANTFLLRVSKLKRGHEITQRANLRTSLTSDVPRAVVNKEVCDVEDQVHDMTCGEEVVALKWLVLSRDLEFSNLSKSLQKVV